MNSTLLERCADHLFQELRGCVDLRGWKSFEDPLGSQFSQLGGGAEKKRLKSIAILVLVVLLSPVLLVWIVSSLLWSFFWGVILRLWFWRTHATQGRPVLFVYSDSPNWQAYIEENILPRIRDRAVILNWSERQHWPAASPWEARFFHRFAGDREFNPVALVFCARGRIKAVRFYNAFLDFKHGKESALRAAEAELFTLVPDVV